MLIAWALAVAILGSGAAAMADVPPDVHTAAEAAFREGTELFAQGRYEEALSRFEASERMDPGPGKRFNMAMSHARLHRPATAWVLFRDAAVEFEHEGASDRAELARARAAEIEPTLPRLRIQVVQPVPRLRVTRNGAEVPGDAWNAEVPVDPGPCVVRAGAPGFRDWEGQVDIPERASTAQIVVPPLEPVPSIAPPLVVPAVKAARGLPQWPAWASFGVALVATGLGAYEGMTASGKWNDAKPLCHASGGGTTCTSQGATLVQSANGYATVSTVAFAVSAVALAGGVALLVVAPATRGGIVALQARF